MWMSSDDVSRFRMGEHPPHAETRLQTSPARGKITYVAVSIRQFKPKVVYPYHYRSHDGMKADFGRLRKLVGSDTGVEIRPREWYPAERQR
jgi:hypothetical protein